MSGVVLMRFGTHNPTAPAVTPLQYLVGSPSGMPMFINESPAANLEYITPAAYLNEAH